MRVLRGGCGCHGDGTEEELARRSGLARITPAVSRMVAFFMGISEESVFCEGIELGPYGIS